MRKQKLNLKRVVVFTCLPLCLYLLFSFTQAETNPVKASALQQETILGAFPIIKPTIKYGFAIDTFAIREATIAPNEFLADILLPHKVDFQTIDQLAKTKDVFDVRTLRAGKPYTILTRDTAQSADYFIYEPSVYRYYIFDLKNVQITEIERPVELKIQQASGVVESSLWNAMVDNGMSPELTTKMEDALAWSIDFHHILQGDKFKLVFEQEYINGEAVGIGEIKAALYENAGNAFYAIRFENDKHNGFYDLEARSMEKAFLKAPVKYSRISSRFNRRRFHPVLRRTRPHLGTDYAAPRGTPIFSVADGVVVKASRTRGNGNFVKVKHDNIYQTQYLHMSRFAKGIRSGVHVKQGQVIGYVGSTGLATGPHVCFRFWKHGKQVNHLKENLPPPDPMPEEDIPAFNLIRDTMKLMLDEIAYPVVKEDIIPREDLIAN